MNILERQVVTDGWRNVGIYLTGVLDTSDAVWPFLSLNDLVNNDKNLTLVGLRLDSINYSISDGILVQLEWNGATPQQMINLAGREDADFADSGGIFPDQTRSGYDGSVNLRTSGYAAGTKQTFTIDIDFVKLYKR